jgi:hypothetical protein
MLPQGAKDMTSKRFVLLLGAAVLVALVAIGLSSRPISPAAPRQFSDRALSIIGAPDSQARVAPENLNCNVKMGWGLAQCGSQASSCKNCHEVKGEDSVNAKGDWHISHAFGDFCEFCHAGNVTATDKAAAHEGMVKPLGDVKANCSSCHADDYQTRAEKYATALGVTVGASSGSQPPAASSGSGQTSSQPSASQPPAQAAQETAPKPAIVLPAKTEVVDYNQPANSVNMGNVITALLLIITVMGGGAFVYWNEKRLRKAKVAVVAGAAAQSGGAEAVTSLDQLAPEVVKLLPTLKQLDPRTLKALRIILSDRRRGEDLLQTLSVINFAVLDEMKRLDKKELSLLLALAAEG